MLDFGDKWTAFPDWAAASLEGPGVAARSVPGLEQAIVGGRLPAALAVLASGVEARGPERIVDGDPYALRLARDRALIIGSEGTLDAAHAGWHEDGFAVTPLADGHIVFALSGPRVEALLARGLNHPLGRHGGSVVCRFADLALPLYRYGAQTTWRLHVAPGFAPYIWRWIETQLRTS